MAAALSLRKHIQTVNTQKVLFDQKLSADSEWCCMKDQGKYENAKTKLEDKMNSDMWRMVRAEAVLKTMAAESKKIGNNSPEDREHERKINRFLAVKDEVEALSKACGVLEEAALKAESRSP